MTFEELQQYILGILDNSIGIRDEQRIMANTAKRVGGDLVDLVEVFKILFSDYLNQFLLTTSDVEFASILTKILTTNEITTPDFVSGLLGSGARLKDGHLELNEITVRQRMNIFLLVYQKAMHQGGLLVLTPWGAEITEVVDGGSYYKCKYDTKGGKIIQPFILDDLLLCQTFDSGNSKRYWRRVTSVGDDYFNLSKTDCEANSGIPTPGDEVFVFGNKTNVARQKALVLCAVGDDAPYYDTYEGINSFSLDGKLCTREGNLSGIVDEVFGQLEGSGLYAKRAYLRGKFALDTGENIGEKITDLQTQINAVPGQIEQSVGGVIDWTKEEITDKIAKTVMVIAQSQVFKYAAGYTGTPTPASILLTVTAKNFTPTAYQWQYLDENTWKDISGVTGATYSVVPGNTTLFPSNIYVRTFRCVCDGNLALSDEFTLAKLADGATGATGSAGKPGDDGKPGADAYTVLLTNEAHTVACDASGNPLSGEVAKAVTKVIAYKGVTAVAFMIQNLVQEGGEFAVDGSDGVKCTSLSANSATCTFEVNVDGIIIKKVFGVTKSKTGATGKDGEPGVAGKGVTSIVEQYYLSTSSTTQSGGSWVTTPPAWVDGRYFWTPSVITYTDGSKSTTPPVCVSGGKGSTGGTGATGATGNGISKVEVLYYLSTSATALSGGAWETTAPAWEDGKYMWSKTKVTYTNGTVVESAAACITGGTGATGRGISSTAVTYQASTSGTTVPAGTWSTAIPSVGAGQFLWTRTIITYTDSTNSTSYSVGKIGETGTPGASGRGIKSTAITYQASASGTTVPTGTWSTTIPSVAANQYLWTRTIITYTDSTTSTAYSIGKMGATGATGTAGRGITSSVVTYQASASGTTVPTGTWVTSIPTVAANQYLWTRTVFTYTDSTTSISYSIGKVGATGATGATGKGVKSTAVTYQASASGTTVPTGTWSSSIPSVAASSYLWTRTIITYTDNTTSVSYSIGKMGATGATGAAGKGVASVVPQYYLSTSSTTTTGGSWSNTIPAWTDGKYIWTRLVTTYTDNSTTTTSPVYDIANKAVDVAYSKVQSGINNLANGITIFAKQTDFNALGTRVGTAEATIKTQAGQISSVVKRTDSLETWKETAETRITQTEKDIKLTVKQGDVINQINLDKSGVTIEASKIYLKGKVTFEMFASDAKSEINNKLETSTFNSLRNSLKSLAYLDKIEQAQLGTTIIQGGHIKTDLIDVDSIFAKNIVFSGSLTSSDYNVTVNGSGASASVTTVGSRYSKSGFVVSSGGGTGILPSSSGVTQVAKIEAIGNQALIVGLEIVVKDTYTSAYLHEQNALVVEARTAYSNPSTRPRSIYSKAGDVVVENGDIVTNGFIYAGQGIRAVPRVTTITPGYNTRKILSRAEIDSTDVIYYYNINNSTQIKLSDADEGKRIRIVNTGTKSGGISDTLSKSANFTLNTWEVLDLIFIRGFHNALGRGWMIVSDYSN